MSLKNSLFDRRDEWFMPDRTLNEDEIETLFELKVDRTQPIYETYNGADQILH